MTTFPKKIVEKLQVVPGGVTSLVKKGESNFRPDVPPPQPPDNGYGDGFVFSTHNNNPTEGELPIMIMMVVLDNSWKLVDTDTGTLVADGLGNSVDGVEIQQSDEGESAPGMPNAAEVMVVLSQTGSRDKKYRLTGNIMMMAMADFSQMSPPQPGPGAMSVSEGSVGRVIIHQWLAGVVQQVFSLANINLQVPRHLSPDIVSTHHMFAFSNLFNQDISTWDTSRVVIMATMFMNATSFDQDISGWDVSNVTYMDSMFDSASQFNQDLSPWCVRKIPTMPNGFDSQASRWVKSRPSWGTCPAKEEEPPYVPPVEEEVDDDTVIKAFDYALVRYRWTPTGGVDLDTRTYLSKPYRVGRKVGWSRLKNDNSYLIWNEDNTGSGVESVLIDIDKIHVDYPGEQIIELKMDGFWYSQVKSGKLDIEFATFKGGKMVASGYDWINEGGLAIQILKLGVDTLVQQSSNIDGENLATLSYDTLLKKGTLIARDGPSIGDGGTVEPEVPVIPPEGGGNGPGGIVDPTNPVYPDSEQGFTFSVEIRDNDGGAVPFEIRLVNVTPGWRVYSGNTLILSAEKIHPQVSANVSMGDVTLTFAIPRKDIKTYTIIAEARTLAFEITQNSYSGQNIAINRFSSTILNHQFSVTDADLTVPEILPSYITSTFNMFLGANYFNQDISMWDTSNVTNMSGMFDNAETFNQDISGWDVSNVTNMMFMFRYAHKFNQPIGSWNVQNVTNMKSMFESAPAFNQDLSKWCVRKIATKPDRFNDYAQALYTSHLPVWGTCPRGEDGPTFYYTRFVTDNPNSGDGSELGIAIDLKNTGGLWQAIDTLTGELLANQDGGKVDGVIVGRYGQYNQSTTVRFNRTGVSTKQHISLGIVYSSDSIRISGASVKEGVDYPPGRVFEITEFSPQIWNYQLFMRENAVKVPSVLPTTLKNCEWFFGECYNIVTDLSGWDTSQVYNTAAMFVNCKSFNQDISNWDVSNVVYMRDMFSGCTNFNQDLSPWSVVKQPSKPSGFDSNCSNWVKPKPVWGTMGRDEPIVVPVPDASQALIFTVVNDGSNAAVYTNLRIEVGHLGKPWQLFEDDRLIASDTYDEYVIARQNKYDMRTLVTLQDRANSTHQYKLFMDRGYFGMASPDSYQYESTTSRHVTLEQFSPIIYKYQFREHTIGNLTLPSEISPAVREADDMFRGCTTFNSDISGWDVSRITVMSGMFYGASSFNQDLSPWNVSSIRSKPSQFDNGTDAWTLPKPAWGTTGTPPIDPTPGGSGTLKFSTRNIIVPNQRMKGSITLSGLSGEWQLLGGGNVLHSNVSTANVTNYTVYLTDWFAHEPIFEFIGTAGRVDIDLPNGFSGNNIIGEVIIESFSNTVAHQTINASLCILTVPETLPQCITSTNKMFRNCSEFNQDISMWDTSNVKDMSFMFAQAGKFNQDISSWDVGQVTNMKSMFDTAKSFNQDLSGWNVSLIPSEPGSFAYSVRGWTLPKPVWGTTGVAPLKSTFVAVDISGASGTFLTLSKNDGPWTTFNLADPGFDVAAFQSFVITGKDGSSFAFLDWPAPLKPEDASGSDKTPGIGGLVSPAGMVAPGHPDGYSFVDGVYVPPIWLSAPVQTRKELNTLRIKQSAGAPAGYDIFFTIPGAVEGGILKVVSTFVFPFTDDDIYAPPL